MGMIKNTGRVITLLCVAITPVLASRAVGRRNAFPKSIRVAGRDEGLYRRLRLTHAKLAAIELSKSRQRVAE